jgi:hypothetical protein
MAKNFYAFSFALGMEAIAFFVLGLENDNKKTKAESLPPCFGLVRRKRETPK